MLVSENCANVKWKEKVASRSTQLLVVVAVQVASYSHFLEGPHCGIKLVCCSFRDEFAWGLVRYFPSTIVISRLSHLGPNVAHVSAVNEELAGTMEMANTFTNAKSSDPASTADLDDGGGQCGWYCWKPKFLQRLSTSKSFLFWICWAGGFQSKCSK